MDGTLARTHTTATFCSMITDAVKIYSFSYRDLHVSKLANVAKAAPLLPEGADGLAAECCLAVSEGATVALQKQKPL